MYIGKAVVQQFALTLQNTVSVDKSNLWHIKSRQSFVTNDVDENMQPEIVLFFILQGHCKLL